MFFSSLKCLRQTRVEGIVAVLSLTFLTACGPDDNYTSPELNMDKGLCYSMTPLLETLPQSKNLGRFVEVRRSCSFYTVSVHYVDKDARGRPRLEIRTKVLDGKSPFVDFFTKDRPNKITDTASYQKVVNRHGEQSLKQLRQCQQYAVELGTAKLGQNTMVMTEKAGQKVCVSVFASSKEREMYGTLYLQPRSDILMEIHYTRSSEEYWHDPDDMAELLLPIVSELNIPASG